MNQSGFGTFNLGDAYSNARSMQQLQRLYNSPGGGDPYNQQSGFDYADDPADSGAMRQFWQSTTRTRG